MFLFCLVFAMSLCASVFMCFVVTCWERADLLALVCGVYCEFVTFPLVSWVRCGTWLYRFLIFALLLTVMMSLPYFCLSLLVGKIVMGFFRQQWKARFYNASTYAPRCVRLLCCHFSARYFHRCLKEELYSTPFKESNWNFACDKKREF